jgi:PAS domain-containing protein
MPLMAGRIPVLSTFFHVFLGAGTGYREQAVEEVPVDARALRALSLDLLGRPPLSAEWQRWRALTRAAVADDLLASAEFWAHWFEEQLYYFLLVNNFRPQQERLAAIPRELFEKRLDPREAIHRIALSSSFDQRNPGADTFVTVVLEQLAGFEIAKNQRELEIGKRVYDGAPGTFLGAAAQSQADLVRNALASRSFVQHFLRREHERLTRAKPGSPELAGWCARLEKDPRCFPELVRDWLQSPAYAARLAHGAALANRTFVRALYVDLADRLPTFEEAEPMREALDSLADSAPLRSITARLLLDSGKLGLRPRKELGDAGVWVRTQFLRLLGREASEAELAEFVKALDEPGARLETVLYALVSSPEYNRC